MRSSLVLSTNISGISPHVLTAVIGAAAGLPTVSLSAVMTTDEPEPVSWRLATVTFGAVWVGCVSPGPVIAVWLSMQMSATEIHIRCELMLRNPMNPSRARANRLENQNLGTVHTRITLFTNATSLTITDNNDNYKKLRYRRQPERFTVSICDQ